jgi:hypothetical protein
MLPNCLLDLQHVRQNHEVVSNLKLGNTKHLGGHRKSELVAAKGIVCMLASRSSIASGRGVLKLLGVDKCNI